MKEQIHKAIMYPEGFGRTEQVIPGSLVEEYIRSGVLDPELLNQEDDSHEGGFGRRTLLTTTLLLGAMSLVSCSRGRLPSFENTQTPEKEPEGIPNLFLPNSDFVNGIALKPGEMHINQEAINRQEFKLNIGPTPEIAKVVFTDYQFGHLVYFGETSSGKEVVITHNIIKGTTLSEIIDGEHTTRLVPVRRGVIKRGDVQPRTELRDIDIPAPIPSPKGSRKKLASAEEEQPTERMADLLFYMTDKAVEELGGLEIAQATIAARVAHTNKANTNSETGNRIRLVGIKPIPEEPGQSSSEWAIRMANIKDGTLDIIDEDRAVYGADLVGVLFFDTSGAASCGSGYRLTKGHLDNPQSFVDHAVSSINTICLQQPNLHALAHEIGHNYGIFHDPATMGKEYNAVREDAVAPDASGYVGRTVADIMAYNQGRATKLYYSSPNIFAKSEPIGQQDVSNAARVMRDVSGTIIPQLEEKVYQQYNLRVTKEPRFFAREGVIQLEGTWDSAEVPTDVVATVNWGDTYPVQVYPERRIWQVSLPTQGNTMKNIPLALYPMTQVDASITSFVNPEYR